MTFGRKRTIPSKPTNHFQILNNLVSVSWSRINGVSGEVSPQTPENLTKHLQSSKDARCNVASTSRVRHYQLRLEFALFWKVKHTEDNLFSPGPSESGANVVIECIALLL